MQFEMGHYFFGGDPERLTELDPPVCLDSDPGPLDLEVGRNWFFRDRVLTLAVGQSVRLGLRTITRTA